MTLTDWKELTRDMVDFSSKKSTSSLEFHTVSLGRVEMGEGEATQPNGLGTGALAQLFDTGRDATGRRTARRESITVTMAFAKHWCAENPGWTWETL